MLDKKPESLKGHYVTFLGGVYVISPNFKHHLQRYIFSSCKNKLIYY